MFYSLVKRDTPSKLARIWGWGHKGMQGNEVAVEMAMTASASESFCCVTSLVTKLIPSPCAQELP